MIDNPVYEIHPDWFNDLLHLEQFVRELKELTYVIKDVRDEEKGNVIDFIITYLKVMEERAE